MSKLKTLFSIGTLIAGIFIVLACQTNSATRKNKFSSAPNPRAKGTPPPKKRVADSLITIAASGDIMLGSPFPNASRMPPSDGKYLLKAVTPVFQAADIAFGNLEGPLADGGISPKCGKGRPHCFAFRMPTRYAQYLKVAGLDVMSVANNHALDFGDSGRQTTRQTLNRLGIKHAGSDRTRFSTTYLTVKGKKIAFIGFAHNGVSLNVNNLAAARRAVRRADRMADIVVVSFHGGAEGAKAQRTPRKTEIFFGTKRGNLPLFCKNSS